MNNAEKGSEITTILGYIFNVSLVYFLFFAIFCGTFTSQFHQTTKPVLAVTTCPVPSRIDGTVSLAVTSNTSLIDCSGVDVIIENEGVLEFTTESVASGTNLANMTLLVRSLSVKKEGTLTVKPLNIQKNGEILIKSLNTINVDGGIEIGDFGIQTTVFGPRLNIQSGSFKGSGLVSNKNGTIVLSCTHPNTFSGSFVVGSGSVDFSGCRNTVVGLPTGLLNKVSQVTRGLYSFVPSNMPLERYASILNQSDSNSSGITEDTVPPGGYISSSDITLSASLSELAKHKFQGETLQMQVELKEVSQDFNGNTGIYTSNALLIQKNEARSFVVHPDGLLVGISYKWRMRTVDTTSGVTSDWEDFGNNSNSTADFTVTSAVSLDLTLGMSTMKLSDSAPITVTVRDQKGNIDTTYVGTVQFQSTGNAAQLPNNYTFTLADKGMHTFLGGLKSFDTGRFSVVVSDVKNPLLVDTALFTVTVPDVTYLQLSTSAKTTTSTAPVTLSWMSNNMRHLSVNGELMETSTSGSYMVTPQQDQTFFASGIDLQGRKLGVAVLVALNNTLEAPRSVTQSCPSLDSFTVSATLVKKSEPFFITWTVGNSSLVAIDAFGSELPMNGIAAVELTHSQDITLFAKNGECTKSIIKHVTVVEAYPWEEAGGMLLIVLILETVALQLGFVQFNVWSPLFSIVRKLRGKRVRGVVYGVVKNMGIGSITVQLWNKTTGKLEDTDKTTSQGFFSFTTRPGDYVIKVVSIEYDIAKAAPETCYAHIYNGGVISIPVDNDCVMISIPVEYIRSQKRAVIDIPKLVLFVGKVLSVIALVLLLAGFIYGSMLVIIYPYWLTFLILGVYTTVVVLKTYVLFAENKKVGHVYGVDGEPIPYVKIAAIDQETKKIVAVTETDTFGKYMFVVPNKNIFIQVKDLAYKILSREVTKDGYLVKKDSTKEYLRIITENILVYPVHKKGKIEIKKA